MALINKTLLKTFNLISLVNGVSKCSVLKERSLIIIVIIIMIIIIIKITIYIFCSERGVFGAF